MAKPKLLPQPKRAVKPKHPTLASRKTCYNGHKMAADNVFLYMGGTWCRRCRAASRMRSRQKRAAEFHAAQVATRKAAKAALADAFTSKAKTNGKAKPTRKAARPRKAA